MTPAETAPPAPPTASSAAASRAAAVEIRGLTKTYGPVRAVSEVDLTVQEGELIALLGASGSGKTTLLRMLAGFETVSAGSIALFGRDVSRLSPADREIGMVFQNYALMPHLTVRRNVEYGLRMRGWSRGDRRERVTEMLARMRLEALGDRLPRQLSGGQQQRVAIARALAYSPKLLLMDEPMGALDKALKQELLTEIRRVHREFSTTIFYVTHDRDEALTLADRVALMSESRLVDCSPVQDMYLRPRTRLAAEFFAGAALFPVRVEPHGDAASLVTLGRATHTVPGLAPGHRSLLAVRPRDLVLGGVEEGWNLHGSVEDSVFLGDDIRVTVRLTDLEHQPVVTVLSPLRVGLSVTRGHQVQVGIDPASVHLVADDVEEVDR